MLRKIVIVQCEVGRELSLEENLIIFKQKPDFVILPEYFNVDPKLRDTGYNFLNTPRHLKYCTILAERFETILIAGTAIESDKNKFYNTCHVFNRNDIAGKYRKTNPTANEQKNQISPGKDQTIIEINEIRVSILICADVLNPDNFDRLRELQPDIVFIPTTSPYKANENEKDKFARDKNIYVDGAQRSGAYIIKCCAVGQLWGGKLQGRSLVAAPWGILNRIAPQDECKERVISTTLDIAELREFRAKQLIHSPAS
jgi:predicted amidohydrolase